MTSNDVLCLAWEAWRRLCWQQTYKAGGWPPICKAIAGGANWQAAGRGAPERLLVDAIHILAKVLVEVVHHISFEHGG